MGKQQSSKGSLTPAQALDALDQLAQPITSDWQTLPGRHHVEVRIVFEPKATAHVTVWYDAFDLEDLLKAGCFPRDLRHEFMVTSAPSCCKAFYSFQLGSSQFERARKLLPGLRPQARRRAA